MCYIHTTQGSAQTVSEICTNTERELVWVEHYSVPFYLYAYEA